MRLLDTQSAVWRWANGVPEVTLAEIAVLSSNLAWQKALIVNIPSGETFSEVT